MPDIFSNIVSFIKRLASETYYEHRNIITNLEKRKLPVINEKIMKQLYYCFCFYEALNKAPARRPQNVLRRDISPDLTKRCSKAITGICYCLLHGR